MLNFVSKIPNLIGRYNGLDVYERTDTDDNHIHCTKVVLDYGLEKAGIENVPFKRYNIKFDEAVATDRCVETTKEDKIIFWQRPGRNGATRFVLERNPEPTNEMLIVICQDRDHDNRLTVVTAYTGKPGTKEPFDNFESEEEQEKATNFWANHALVPTQDEAIKMMAAGIVTEEDVDWLFF